MKDRWRSRRSRRWRSEGSSSSRRRRACAVALTRPNASSLRRRTTPRRVVRPPRTRPPVPRPDASSRRPTPRRRVRCLRFAWRAAGAPGPSRSSRSATRRLPSPPPLPDPRGTSSGRTPRLLYHRGSSLRSLRHPDEPRRIDKAITLRTAPSSELVGAFLGNNQPPPSSPGGGQTTTPTRSRHRPVAAPLVVPGASRHLPDTTGLGITGHAPRERDHRTARDAFVTPSVCPVPWRTSPRDPSAGCDVVPRPLTSVRRRSRALRRPRASRRVVRRVEV